MASKITPELDREILVRAAEGLSAAEIARWLHDNHGVKVSRQALQKRLAKTRTERADMAKAVVREKLARTLAPDLDDLNENGARLMRLIRATDDEDDERLVRLVEQHRKLVDTRLKYSGADQPDDVATSLADFLARGFGGSGESGAP